MTNETFIVAVISPDPLIREQLAHAVEESPLVAGLWTLAEYPSPTQLARIREARTGCVVLLDFSNAERARVVAAEIDQSYPMAATIAVYDGAGPQDLLALMQLGIREVITLPVTAREASEALARASRKTKREPEPEGPVGSIHSFLPARPGSGATTLATYTAVAAARLSGEGLLIDFDLRLGMTSFLLKLHSEHSVLDALLVSERLEDTVWEQVVGHREELDVLGSAPVEFDRLTPSGGSVAVLEFARRKYQNVCVDLPGEMRDHELETLTRSKEIFLICTPDVGALHMAKRKMNILQSLGVQGAVSLILNRAQARGAMLTKDVEAILGMPVRFTVPSAEGEIREATEKAATLSPKSAVGAVVERIARRIAGDAVAAERKPRRFIQFFSVTPVRDNVRR